MAKKDGGSKKPQASDREKFEAVGLNAAEIQALDLKGIDFKKLITFVVGLYELWKKTFPGVDTVAPDGGNGGGIFGAQKAPTDEKERLKDLGVPAKAAALGGGNLLKLIKFVLSLLGGVGGVLGAAHPSVVTHIERKGDETQPLK